MRISALLVAFALCLQTAHAAEVKEVVTPAGIRAWLVEEHSLPLIAAKIVFKDSGTAHDPKGKEGRALLTTELMFEGAGDKDALAFAKALEERAINLQINVDEDLFSAALHTLSEQRDTAFALLGDALTKPRFTPESITRTRTRMLASLKQMQQSPNHALLRAWRSAVYPNHPYSQPGEGTEASIRALARKDFADFTARYLTKENVIIAVVGDITPEELSALLDKHLAALPAAFKPDTTVADVQVHGESKTVRVEKDIPQTLVMFGLQGLKRNDPRYFDAYVLNYIIGGGGSLTSRLSSEIREKRGLTYSAYSQLNPLLHGALWEGGFSTRTEKAQEAVDVMRDTLKRIAEQGVAEQELDDAKRYLMGSFVLNLDSNAEVANFLISMQLNGLGKDYLDKRNGYVNAVTRESVMAVAKQLLTPDKLIVATVGK